MLQRLIGKIKKAFYQESLAVNQQPLQFTDLAIAKIKEYLQQKSKGFKLVFQISLNYKLQEVVYKVGFTEGLPYRQSKFLYPVPLLLEEIDELYLHGSYLDFHEEAESFFIYPDIKLEVESTPDPTITKFTLNRYIIVPTSEKQEFSIAREDWQQEPTSYPKLIQSLFAVLELASLYIHSNCLQCEYNTLENEMEKEKRIANVLLEYFERNNYPLLYQNSSWQVQIPGESL
ncbi:MAG: hypothetical protein AAF518_05590 [Spirochaetota bacterium]